MRNLLGLPEDVFSNETVLNQAELSTVMAAWPGQLLSAISSHYSGALSTCIKCIAALQYNCAPEYTSRAWGTFRFLVNIFDKNLRKIGSHNIYLL